MIKTNDLKEYAALMALKSYCNNHNANECEECRTRSVCACMAVAPSSWEIEYDEITKEDIKK